MPKARTSLKAEQDDLRSRMRTLGLGYDEIAAEFSRRYRLRPRTAWRHAYGWTLKQAADQINTFTARAGMDPDGKAGMTGPHLCEHEQVRHEALTSRVEVKDRHRHPVAAGG